ncbi:MAG: isoprenylcysteine carboxylmethyltransferase family protein [Pirellulaceae bacterium]|jgi:protein-S-isoprenylcysteine O-methyltransferase Ste14|nr:isoprenylcysteine carboxylmethyltransferase family protein [Pirellulaceae bacterium]
MTGDHVDLHRDWLARGLVLAQFVLAGAIVLSTPWRAWPPPPIGFLAVLLLLVGSGVAMWAWFTMGSQHLRIMPHPHQEAKLLRHGPYRWIRHPMYAGLLLATLGCCLWSGSLTQVAFWLGLVVVLFCKTRIEEDLLSEKFADYEQYRQSAGRFSPKIWRG